MSFVFSFFWPANHHRRLNGSIVFLCFSRAMIFLTEPGQAGQRLHWCCSLKKGKEKKKNGRNKNDGKEKTFEAVKKKKRVKKRRRRGSDFFSTLLALSLSLFRFSASRNAPSERFFSSRFTYSTSRRHHGRQEAHQARRHAQADALAGRRQAEQGEQGRARCGDCKIL